MAETAMIAVDGDPLVGALIGLGIVIVVAMLIVLARRRGSPIE